MSWNSCKYSSKDNNRTSISYSKFCDEITKPEKNHSSSSNKCHSRKHNSPEISSINDWCTASTYNRIKKIYHTIALRKSERNSQISSIIIEFLLSLFSLLLEILKRWNNNRKKLNDNSCIDIWSKSHENNREILKSTSHNRSKECELSIGSELCCICFEKCYINSRNWHISKEYVHSNHSNRKQNLFTDMFCCPDFFNIGYHKIMRKCKNFAYSRENMRKCKWKYEGYWESKRKKV